MTAHEWASPYGISIYVGLGLAARGSLAACPPIFTVAERAGAGRCWFSAPACGRA